VGKRKHRKAKPSSLGTVLLQHEKEWRSRIFGYGNHPGREGEDVPHKRGGEEVLPEKEILG